MGDAKVEIIARLAQWKTEGLGPPNSHKTSKRSDPFKIVLWNWRLSMESVLSNSRSCIRLFPEPSQFSENQPPFARFVLRVTTAGSNRRPYISPIHERLFRTSDDFTCSVDIDCQSRFVIDVEFLDLEICPPNGGEGSSIWPSGDTLQHLATQSSSRCFSRMLNDSIYADITINASDGKLQAHKANLSASSPVFHSMFQHDLKEKESSTIDIQDMTSESCMALLSFLYGSVKQEEFWKHRLTLLGAANKYDIADLKDACEECLLEDISSGNVVDRLQEAWLYQLSKLKKGCFEYLLDFGKIHDVREEMNGFFRKADRELVVEMFDQLLAANIAPLGPTLYVTETKSVPSFC